MADVKLNFQLQAKNNVSVQLRSISNQASKVERTLARLPRPLRTLGRVGVGVASTLKTVAGAAFSLQGALAGASAAFAVKRAVDEAINLENALVGLSSVAASTGQNVDAATLAAKELAEDGLIPLNQVSGALKNLLAGGLELPQAIKLFKAFRDSASFGRQAALSLGEAVEGATQGFKNQLSTLVDNAGITKNLSVLQKEFAASIGTTVGRLTEAQKTQANYVGLLREGAIFQGDYNKLQDTFSGALSKVTGRLRFLVAELGSVITKNPIIIEQTKRLADFFGRLLVSLRENQQGIQDFITNGLERIPGIIDTIIVSLVRLGSALLILNAGSIAASFVRSFRLMQAAVGALRITLDELATGKALDGLAKSLFSVRTAAILTKAALSVGLTLAIDALITKSFELKQGLEQLTKPVLVFQKSFSAAFAQLKVDFLTFISEFIESSKGLGLALSSIPVVGPILAGASSSLVRNKLVEALADPIKVAEQNAKALNKELAQTIAASTKIRKVSRPAGRPSAGGGGRAPTSGSAGAPTTAQGINDFIVNSLGGLRQAAVNIGGAFEQSGDQAAKFNNGISLLQDNVGRILGSFGPQILRGLAAGLASGKDGARKIISTVSGAIGTALGGPVVGQAVAQVVDLLAQGPEVVKRTIDAFVEQIPVVFQNIVESLPVFLEALIVGVNEAFIRIADNIDVIVERFIDRLVQASPRIAVSLATALTLRVPIALAKSMPAVAKSFMTALITEAPRFISALVDEIKGALSNIGGGIASAGGGFGDILGFQSGGKIAKVPGGFPNDSALARISSGELIVSQATTNRLEDFLANQSGGGGSETNNLLAQVVGLLQQPVTVSGEIMGFNQDAFAEQLITINRTNTRSA